MDDIAKIAEGLTEAQRRLLLAHRDNGKLDGRHWRDTPTKDVLSWNISGRKLRQARLIDWAEARGETTILTTLGLAVRAHLERER